MTEEAKEKLREQLKKGRETSMINRQKSALAKRLSKKDAEDEKDAILAESILKRSKKTAPTNNPPPKQEEAKVAEPKHEAKVSADTSELDALKKELADLKNMFISKPPKAPEPKEDPKPTPVPKAHPKPMPFPVKRVAAMRKRNYD